VKKILVLFAVALFTFVSCESKSADNNNLSWETDLGAAIAKAKQENKTVLVDFTGSDWCKWCFKLNDEVFSHSEFEDFAKDNLVLVKVDFPQNIQQSNETKMYNNSLMQKFGVTGFPTIILLNSSGKVLAVTGYQTGGAANYVSHLKSFI
jgi:disulfide reductase